MPYSNSKYLLHHVIRTEFLLKTVQIKYKQTNNKYIKYRKTHTHKKMIHWTWMKYRDKDLVIINGN